MHSTHIIRFASSEQFIRVIFIFSRYIQILWALEIVPTHKDRAFEDCTTDLQVPVIIGAFIECVATCICRVVSRVLGELNPRCSNLIDSFVGTSLVVAGEVIDLGNVIDMSDFHYFQRNTFILLLEFFLAFSSSGGYFNPALATALKYGCLGTSVMEHVIVYWVGACAGSVASIRVYQHPMIQNFIKKQKHKSQ